MRSASWRMLFPHSNSPHYWSNPPGFLPNIYTCTVADRGQWRTPRMYFIAHPISCAYEASGMRSIDWSRDLKIGGPWVTGAHENRHPLDVLVFSKVTQAYRIDACTDAFRNIWVKIRQRNLSMTHFTTRQNQSVWIYHPWGKLRCETPNSGKAESLLEQLCQDLCDFT